MATIFHYEALPVNANFGAGIINPPAAVAPVNPGRKALTEAVRTRDDEPSDADRIAHYFADEIRAANAIIESDAAEYEALASLAAGYFHG